MSFELQNHLVKFRRIHNLCFKIRKSTRICLFFSLRIVCSIFLKETTLSFIRVSIFSRFQIMKKEFIVLGRGYRSMDDLRLLRRYSLCRMFTIQSFRFLSFPSDFLDHVFTEAQLFTRLFTFIMKKTSL